MKTKEESSVFNEWAEVTTAHGFYDFAHAETKAGKVIWFLLIFVSLALMCYQLSRGINEFANHEWKTSIEEIASNDSVPMKFPSLIVCNVNRLKWSKAQQYNMTLDMISYMFYNLKSLIGYMVPNDSAVGFENDFIKWRKAHNFSYFDIFDKIAPNCEDIFVRSKDICAFSISIDTLEYGRCQRYEPTSSTNYVGSRGGYTIMLDVQSDDYVPMVENNHIGQGLMIQLVYGAEEYGQWSTLNPGVRTSIAMQINENTVLKKEQSWLNPFGLLNSKLPCSEKPTMMFTNASRYNSANAWLDCQWLIAYTVCNCIPYSKTQGYRTCEVEELLKCQYTSANLTQIEFEDLQFEVNRCVSSFKPACTTKTVDTQLSITQFSSDQQHSKWEQWIESSGDRTVKTKDLIMLDIYFSSFNTKLFQQYEVMSFDDLISSSGGLIGLWAGMSFLTIFQAVAFLMKHLKRVKEERFHTKIKKVGRSQSF